jgi:hypothetical protein
MMRRYYFYVSHLGHLYPVENAVQTPFGPTYLKEKRFLKFFFSHLRRSVISDNEDLSVWPFVSVCGRELNFVRSASRTPVVFQQLHENVLFYGEGALSTPFCPSLLALSSVGELYHPIKLQGKLCWFCLIVCLHGVLCYVLCYVFNA